MNSRLILLALPLVFFACEAAEAVTTFVGTWNLTAMDEYSGASCIGTPEWTLDSTKAIFGDDVTLTLEFTEDQLTMTSDISLSADALCAMMGATLEGDSCIATQGNVAVDAVCTMMEGTYANSTCSFGDSQTSSYTTVEDAITVTHYAGTDSAEVETGTWSIASDVLTMSLASDSSCTSMTLSK
ncbi:MAG: hypothetical protein H8D58_03155 [Candidatus Marinimicrobia bacterium]|nr:hypothetical protein [Candidatus Neomarinimicrobiota bacterium]